MEEAANRANHMYHFWLIDSTSGFLSTCVVLTLFPLANEVANGYINTTVRLPETTLWTTKHSLMDLNQT
jgi:hypothetical protein